MSEEKKNKEEQKKMEDVSRRKEKGITLIALVITIIVLLILAGVTINLTIGERGIFTTAQKAAKNYTNAQNKELASLDAFDEEINGAINILGTGWNETKKVNAPQIAEGLTPVIISDDGTITEVSQYSNNWYDYENSKWANAKSADGSLWVWIPRYAYKIKYNDGTNKSAGGEIEVVFLKGTSDLAEDNNLIIKRVAEVKNYDFDENGYINDEDAYIVHPAFCDGSSNRYLNGEWNSEIPGFWMAKFEAGYAGTSNDPDSATESKVKYKTAPSNNFYQTDGITTSTAIKYPEFKANRPSFNNISIGDAFELCNHLTDNGNIYGFNTRTIDSHLVKNSEWGAVSYLSWSKYGTNKVEISINNVRTELQSELFYAVTGFGAVGPTDDYITLNFDELSKGMSVGSWESKQGQLASTTKNITGIYDMSGGLWERVASGVQFPNGNWYTRFIDELESEPDPKHFGVYYADRAHLESEYNYNSSSEVKGDAIHETSASYDGGTSWNSDASFYPDHSDVKDVPFFLRGNVYSSKGWSGLFSFSNSSGELAYDKGFRAILIVN